MRTNKRNSKSLAPLYVGDSVEVVNRHKLFANQVGEVTEVKDNNVYIDFINSGCYFGSGLYQRYEVRLCSPLIPLVG